MPVVEGGELINKVHKSWDLAFGVVSHDLFSSALGRDSRIGIHLALDKAVQTRLQLAASNILVGWVVGAVHFIVDTSY